MGFRDKVKQNVPRVDLQSYIFLLAGTFKSGKTRFWKELMEYYYPNEPDAGLLVAWETGYKSWKLKSFIDLTEHTKEEVSTNRKPKIRSDIELDADRWEFFKKDIVSGLVQESRDGRTSKIIGFDTVDRMIDCASAFLIVKANNKYVGNDFTSVQELSESKIYLENIWTNLYDELKRPLDSLRSAGYGLVYLAWTKEKTTELIDGMKYNSIELMMNATCRKVFQSQADLICCIHNETKVINKDGEELKKNVENKKGKEVASNFHETETQMYFRESNYISIAGGRFIDLPEKTPYGVTYFDEVFRNAVKGQLDGDESVETILEEEVKIREEKAQTYAEGKQNEYSVSELIEKIAAEADRFTFNFIKDNIAPTFKKILGSSNYTKSEDSEGLANALAFIKDVKTPV